MMATLFALSCAGVVSLLSQSSVLQVDDEEPVLPSLNLPLVLPQNLPESGNYFSAAHEDWPPLPFPYRGTNCQVFSIATALGLPASAPYFVVDDRAIVALELLEAAAARESGMMALNSSVPGFPGEGEGGEGGGETNYYYAPVYGSNDLWIELDSASITNGTGPFNLLLHIPSSHTNEHWYVYGTTNLGLPSGYGVLNATNWVWVASTTNGATNVVVSLLESPEAYFKLSSSLDLDADGIPDDYEWAHFGTVPQSATDDFDGDGINNGTEYTNSTDPNSIQFTMRFADLYVNSRTVVGACEIQMGVPAQVAVLVDDTNLAAAAWLPYTSSNVSITLPDADGAHTVLVALRGRTAQFPAAEDWTELTLDRAAPVLTITNPILSGGAATVLKPYLQLQGFANEPLAVLSYDLTNALGLVTNEPLAVVDQFFDTNQFDFTTNWFQAYDIPLTNGANALTLRVTDLAGNVSTTNLTVTLDYTGATNPPVVQSAWPTNGMQLSGESFYIRGIINDETAQIHARTVSGTGETNEYAGVVERDGKFWVENLPLAAGTNVVEVVATDAAGNSSSSFLSVVKSDVNIAISSAPQGESLYDGSGFVSGTVSDTNFSVTVNGAAADLDASGNWTAQNVSIHGRGTAIFDVRAHRSAGGNPTTVEASVQVEMPAAIKITKHWMRQSGGSTGFSQTKEKDYSAKYAPAPPGVWAETEYKGTYVVSVNYDGSSSEAKYEWSQTNPAGTVRYDGGAPQSFEDSEDLQVKALPHVDLDRQDPMEDDEVGVVHYYAKGVKHQWPEAGGQPKNELSARTRQTLYTGGKAGVKRKSLIHLSAWAQAYGKPAQYDWRWTLVNSTNVAPTNIMVFGWWLFGRQPLDANGDLFLVMPDNATRDLNLKVRGAKHYQAYPTVEKHGLVHFTQNPALTDTNLARTKLGVGEEVYFGFAPSLPDGFTNLLWSATAGGFDFTNAAATKFTAPSNAASVTVSVNVNGTAKMGEAFTVVEPSGFDHTVLTHTFPNLWPTGQVAVAMQNRVWIAPTDVSFYRVLISEFGKDANPVTGYFADTNKFTTDPGFWFHHWPGGTTNDNFAWGPLDSNNEIGGGQLDPGDIAALVPTTAHPYSPPWSAGTIYVDIPVKWKIGVDGPTNSLANGWDQRVTIDANGTLVIEKFGQSTTRTVNNIVTPNIP